MFVWFAWQRLVRIPEVRLYSKKIYRLYFLSALKRLKKFSEMRKLNLLKRVINVENRED